MEQGKKGSILLGRTREGRKVRMDYETRRTHMQIIGSTGEGKTKFMEHLIREDIIHNNGLCLIDLHGHFYNDIVRWCETKRLLGRKRIMLFDPSEEEWTFGFNPLKVSSRDLSFHVDWMVKACAKVWGGEDTDKTPLLKRCLKVLFYVLAEKKLSLLEAQYLINPLDENVRKYLTQDIEDLTIRKQWDYFNDLKPKQFYDEFGSTINRMMEFLGSKNIRNIIGQIEHTIDFRKMMDEGWVLIVNLAAKGKVSRDNARMLGTLIINDLFMNALERAKGARPFYLYIDECAFFINEDIGFILDEGRKFGLHLILAHQHLSQLREAGEKIYHSVMTDAKTKVIFGGSDPQEAETLARQVFLGELDLEEPKEILNKPTVIRYIREWLNSDSHSTSNTIGSSHSVTASDSTIQTNSTATNEEGHSVTTMGSSIVSSHSETESSNWSDSRGKSWGRSEALRPELEDRPTQVYSLEEQIHKAMALMVNQPTQHALIKLPKEHTQMVKIPTVKDGYARDERVLRFKNECYMLTEFVKPKELVEKELKQRCLLLDKKAQKALEPEVLGYPTKYRE